MRCDKFYILLKSFKWRVAGDETRFWVYIRLIKTEHEMDNDSGKYEGTSKETIWMPGFWTASWKEICPLFVEKENGTVFVNTARIDLMKKFKVMEIRLSWAWFKINIKMYNLWIRLARIFRKGPEGFFAGNNHSIEHGPAEYGPLCSWLAARHVSRTFI